MIDEETSPLSRSDELDRKIIAVTAKSHVTLISTLVFIVILNVGMAIVLGKLATDNHHVLTSQIPGLQHTIQERDQTIKEKNLEISDLNFILNKQAVPAILKMARQIEALGGKPPNVILKPPEHPKQK